MKNFLFYLDLKMREGLLLKQNFQGKKQLVKILLFISTFLILLSGCCSDEVLKRFTIILDNETMVGLSHHEFQADSCFKIGNKFIAFSNRDSIVYNLAELYGEIKVKCNAESYEVNNEMVKDASLSTVKK